MAYKQCQLCKKILKGKQQKYCSGFCRQRDWVMHNRFSHNEAVRKYRAKRYKEEGRWYDNSPKSIALKNWMIELKSKPCQDCNTKFSVCCMDFDHRIGEKKTYNIGSMFAHHYSRELIEKELKKCDLVCANCHRIRTQKRRTGSGKYK